MIAAKGVKGRFSLNGTHKGRPRLTPDLVFNALVNANNAFLPRNWGSDVNLIDQDGVRDLDREFKYPVNLTMPVLRQLYTRNAIARKIIRVYADECAATKPDIYQVEDDRVTPWERRFNEVRTKARLDHYLHRIDVQAGIQSYGGLLVRTNDGRNLRQAPAGVNPDGTRGVRRGKNLREIVFIRPLAQDHCRVAKVEKDDRNPRYGLPTEYEVDLDAIDFESHGVSLPTITGKLDEDQQVGNKVRVHWSRIVHVPSDLLEESDWYGTPRVTPVANLLWDLRKVLGSAAEMWFRGAFMGISFETQQGVNEFYDVDMDDLKDEIEAFQNGLQRYLRLVNMKANPLAPQIEDPKNHVQLLISIIAAVSGVPMPILMGAEVGKADGGQNMMAWHRRLSLRNHDFVEPYLWRNLIDRLTLLDVLPPVPEYKVYWKDLHTQTEKDRADVALKLTQSLLQYVTSGAYKVVTPRQFFTNWLKFSDEVANAMIREAGGEKKILSQLESMMKMQNPQPIRPGLTPGSKGTTPARKTGASGSRNAVGKGKPPKRTN